MSSEALVYNRNRKYSRDTITQVQRIVGVEPTGSWTAETVAAVREFQQSAGLTDDGKVGPGTLDAIMAADQVDDGDDHEREDMPMSVPDTDSSLAETPLEQLRTWCSDAGVELVDYRDLKEWPRSRTYPKEFGYPRDKSRAQPPRGGIRRAWSTITTFMLHTTAVAGMTKQRGVGIPAHLYLPRENAIVLCHELELLLYHGHAGNGFSVGLEISGVSAWDSPSQVERARALLRYFQATRRAMLGPDAGCYVMAHRQSHASRVNDPGKPIWQDAGEWAIRELGFELGPVVGSGRPLDAWR
jgi:hypothetical protein